MTLIFYYIYNHLHSFTRHLISYVSAETTEISTRRDLGGSDSALIGAIWEHTMVQVNNARLLEDDKQMKLDSNGFQLWTKNPANMSEGFIQQMDFCNQDQVVDNYYPLCESLVSEALMSQESSSSSSTSIKCICAFDHNVRSNDKSSVGKIHSKHTEQEAANPQVQNPAGLVHADYTKTSAPKRLHDLSNPPKLNDVLRPKLFAQNKQSLLDPNIVQEALDGKRRYAFINVWRSIDAQNPVMNPPLACVDATTTTVDDLRTFKIHYVDRVGENYFVCPREQHAWYYYPEMTMQEVLLLKQWDSHGKVACGAQSDGMQNNEGKDEDKGNDGSGLSTFTIHSAFIDSTFNAETPPRKSIEVRCVVIWEEE